MKRITAAIAAAAFVCGLAWVGGFDFERGPMALMLAIPAIWAAVAAYMSVDE